MKKIFYSILIPLSSLALGQIGVNVNSPKSTLHVDGSVQVTNSLNLGGNDKTPGDPGKTGTFLVSQGEGQPAMWATPVTLNIPSVSGIAKTNLSINNIIARSATTFKYNNQKRINPEVLSYNTTTGEYTIKKEGYYMINANATISVSSSESNTDGSLTFSLFINNVQTLTVLGAFPNSAPNPMRESLAGIYYLKANDTFFLRVNHTRSYNLVDGNISITYLFKP